MKLTLFSWSCIFLFGISFFVTLQINHSIMRNSQYFINMLQRWRYYTAYKKWLEGCLLCHNTLHFSSLNSTCLSPWHTSSPECHALASQMCYIGYISHPKGGSDSHGALRKRAKNTEGAKQLSRVWHHQEWFICQIVPFLNILYILNFFFRNLHCSTAKI